MQETTIQWINRNPSRCIAPYINKDLRIADTKFKITCCCNLDTTDVAELDHGFINNIQQQQAQGIMPQGCHKCITDEENNAQSERIKLLIDYTPNELTEIFNNTRKPNFQIGMKFSNQCNLACRSCQQTDSSYWATIMKTPAHHSYEIDISTNDTRWQTITDTIRAKHKETDNFIVHPIGGETMIQPGFVKLLEFLIAENLASTTSLRITTSLVTNLSKKFQELFLHFKKIVIIASIDSIGDNYYCVRWPAQFNKVENNLQTILKINRENSKKIELCINPVFSLNNIFYSVDILNWWANWAETNNVPLFMSTIYLHSPEMLMIESLAIEYRDPLITMLEQCVNHRLFKLHPKTTVLYNYFKTMLDILKTHQTDPESKFQDYLRYTADYDKRTKTSSMQLNNKLFSLLSDTHLKIYNDYYGVVNVNNPVYNTNSV